MSNQAKRPEDILPDGVDSIPIIGLHRQVVFKNPLIEKILIDAE